MANINIDQLASEITKAVREYTEDVTAAIEAKVDETAKQVMGEIKATAPKNTGEYGRTFTITNKNGKRYIWNRKHYRRVHLLEFGHAKVGGGRVAARPHMRPAYDKHAANLPEDIKRIIQNGG